MLGRVREARDPVEDSAEGQRDEQDVRQLGERVAHSVRPHAIHVGRLLQASRPNEGWGRVEVKIPYPVGLAFSVAGDKRIVSPPQARARGGAGRRARDETPIYIYFVYNLLPLQNKRKENREIGLVYCIGKHF